MKSLSNYTPEIYSNESRDFQLISRLYDAVFSGVKYNIDAIRHTANTSEINSVLLPLLQNKLGFFSTEVLDEDQLRGILMMFPYIIKYKGSKRAITQTLNAWFRLNKVYANLESIEISEETSEIILNVEALPADSKLLDAVLTYVLPTGYTAFYNYIVPVDLNDSGADFNITKSELTCKVPEEKDNSIIISTKPEHPLLHAIGLTATTNTEVSNSIESEDL